MKGGILSCGYDSALEGKSASRCLLLVICVTLALAIICILTKHRGKLGTYVWKSNLTAQNHRDEHFANLYLVVDSCVYVVFLSEDEKWAPSCFCGFFFPFWLLNCCCQDRRQVLCHLRGCTWFQFQTGGGVLILQLYWCDKIVKSLLFFLTIYI